MGEMGDGFEPKHIKGGAQGREPKAPSPLFPAGRRPAMLEKTLRTGAAGTERYASRAL
jgi:hypothetical protein